METTMSSSNMNTERLTTDTVETKSLILNKTTVVGVETGAVNPKDEKLVGLSYLSKITKKIDTALKAIDPDSDLYANLASISLPLTDPYFSDRTAWKLNHWELADNYAIYSSNSGSRDNNALTFSNTIYPNKGHYFAIIDVVAINSGYIEFRVNDEHIATIEDLGKTLVEFEIKDTSVDKVSIVAVNVNSAELITLNSVSIHYLTERFYTYFTEMLLHKYSITPDNYVTVENYEHSQREFMNNIRVLTDRYLAELDAHKEASNPHEITPELIHAARADHSHSEYLSASQCATEVERHMANFALKDHEHPEYLTEDEADSKIDELVTDRMRNVLVTDPMIVVKAPSGILPSRWAQTNITPPVPLLVPSVLDHNAEGSYDWVYGIATTNHSVLMNESPKVFSRGQHGSIPGGTITWGEGVVNFRMQFHTLRKIEGYTITTYNSKVTDWRVISGNTTFIHRVTDPDNIQTDDAGVSTCTIYFDEVVEAESLAFQLLNATPDTDGSVKVNIEFLTVDYDKDSFGIAPSQYEVAVPFEGSNEICLVGESNLKFTPEVIVDDTPLYVFYDAHTNKYSVSYYPLEVNNTRRGIDVFTDKFTDIEQDSDTSIPSFTHPAYGKLSLTEGYSREGSKLTNIYSSSTDGWVSEGNTSTITITQTFDSDNVMLCGYILNWRNEDIDNVPDSWTLSVEGTNVYGETVTVVLDSVEKYYPFYSVEDDDIVYHSKCHSNITIKKLTLTMSTTKPNSAIALNKLFLYVSEHYYAVPLNTMYLGDKTSARICLGSLVHNKDTGWVPRMDVSVGRTCVVPVNNLEPMMRYMDYHIPNPFHTQDITVSVENYILQDSELGQTPQAYVSNISAEWITVTTTAPFRHGLAISRIW